MNRRRKIASLVLLVGGLLIAGVFMRAREKQVEVEITYRLGPATWVERLESELRPAGGGDTVARYLVKVDGAGEVRHKTRVPPGDYEAHITLSGGGRTVMTTRRVQAARGALVYVNLESTRPR